MSHAVERIGGAMQELSGKAAFRLGNLVHSERLQAGGRSLQEHGVHKREAADAAAREDGIHMLDVRVEELFGVEDEAVNTPAEDRNRREARP